MGERARREILPGLVAALGLIALAGASIFFTSRPQALSPSPTKSLMATHNPSPTPPSPKVGILSGHWKYGGGAICPDGVQEEDIAHEIATKVVVLLEEKGYRVDLLAEFDPALQGYKADALVALHADSCIPGVSGFKVARAWNSFIPEVEDELVNCLYEEYERATGLKPHLESITIDMRGYHAFGKVAPATPAAIVEMGFMADDAGLLRNDQGRVAQGVVAGIECFLEKSKTQEQASP